MGEVADAYAQCRDRITALVGGIADRDAAMPVPTCPGWSVHDVVAHLAGVVADALAGRMEGVTTDPWTAAQVAAGRGRPVTELLKGWAEASPEFEALLDGAGRRGRQAVGDAVSHEHDIRAALGQPGARQSAAVGIGLGFAAASFADSAASRGISVAVRTLDGRRFGPDEAQAVLTAADFDLLRALTGRRSVRQLREMSWAGDAGPALPAFTYGPFHPASQDITE
jgi:uncharacterized protein (TIGR03083 family)